jgi:DNA repair protein RadC
LHPFGSLPNILFSVPPAEDSRVGHFLAFGMLNTHFFPSPVDLTKPAQYVRLSLVKAMNKADKIDKPREKLEKKGISALSNQELIMLILGSGIKGRNVKAQALDVLKVLEADIGNISFEKLNSISGIGTAKAGQIMAAFELAKRYLIKQSKKIQNVADILEAVGEIRTKKQEHFVTLTLSGASVLIEKRIVFKGTVDSSLVHPREVFADALIDRAAGIILVHNHPADNPEPSQADIAITTRLCETGKLLGIKVIDHVIVTADSYFSFEATGLLSKENGQ